MMVRPAELWCVQTSNNTDSFNFDEQEMFTEEIEAVRFRDELIRTRHYGRPDYLVRNVAVALYEAVRAAQQDAMSED